MKRILCFLGLHDWYYFKTCRRPGWSRVCNRCSAPQYQTYDMAYGETYWVKGKRP